MAVTDKNPDVLARILWGEARGEGLNVIVAVAWTIRNRVEDGKTASWRGEGYSDVCQKPYPFRCWNENDPNFSFLRIAKPIPARELAQCRLAADLVIKWEGIRPYRWRDS